jgi:hypothetical protein
VGLLSLYQEPLFMGILKAAAGKALEMGASKGLSRVLTASSSGLLKRLPAALIVETALTVGKESIAVMRKEKTLLQAADTLGEKTAEIGGASVGAALGIAAAGAVGGGLIVTASVSAGAAYCLGVAGQKAYQATKAHFAPKEEPEAPPLLITDDRTPEA